MAYASKDGFSTSRISHLQLCFVSLIIKHNPQAEGARAVFGLKDDNNTPKDLYEYTLDKYRINIKILYEELFGR